MFQILQEYVALENVTNVDDMLHVKYICNILSAADDDALNIICLNNYIISNFRIFGTFKNFPQLICLY